MIDMFRYGTDQKCRAGRDDLVVMYGLDADNDGRESYVIGFVTSIDRTGWPKRWKVPGVPDPASFGAEVYIPNERGGTQAYFLIPKSDIADREAIERCVAEAVEDGGRKRGVRSEYNGPFTGWYRLFDSMAEVDAIISPYLV